MDKFEIPLVIKGKQIGVVETIVMDTREDGFPEFLMGGTFFNELEKPEVLVKLLQKEGIHLGKP